MTISRPIEHLHQHPGRDLGGSIKERPILFSGPMVRAILRDENQKTQTRRPINFRKTRCQTIGERDDGSRWPWSEDEERGGDYWHPSPYGQPGDRLWVREAWGLHAYGDETDWHTASCAGADEQIRGSWNLAHRADWGPCQEGCHWRPSIHMPRWASRIALEITGVRVERLQDISEEDAEAEGMDVFTDGMGYSIPGGPWQRNAADVFRNLWESINGKGSWDASPWVWVVEFRRLP